MSKDGLKGNCGEPSKAAMYAKNSRTARAGSFDGGMPPGGPAKEPTRINGVPKIPSKGIK